MRKIFTSLVLALMAVSSVFAAEAPKGLNVHNNYSLCHFTWDCYDLNLTESQALKMAYDYLVGDSWAYDYTLTDLKQPQATDKNEHHYYTVYLKGKLEEGCLVVVSLTKDGRPYYINGTLSTSAEKKGVQKAKKVFKAPAQMITPQEALSKVADAKGTPELCAIAVATDADSGDTHFAYKVQSGIYNVYVDAATGEELTRISLLQTVDNYTPASGQVETCFSGKRSMDFSTVGNVAALYDTKRSIYTYEAGDIASMQMANYINPNWGPIEAMGEYYKYLNLDVDTLSNNFSSATYQTNGTPYLGMIYLQPTAYTIANVDSLVIEKIMASEGTYTVTDAKNNVVASGKFTPYAPKESPQSRSAFNDDDSPLVTLSRSDLYIQFALGDYQSEKIELPICQAGFKRSLDFRNASNYIEMSVNTVNICGGKKSYFDIHWGMGQVYDYYLNNYGLKSYDGKGSPIVQYANCSVLLGGSSGQNSSAAPGLGVGAMEYGLGSIHTEYGLLPLVELSVMGHEFTHLVQGGTPIGGLVYQRESGALNESFADIMGINARQYATGASELDWRLGGQVSAELSDIKEQITFDELLAKNNGTEIRNIANPGKCNQPNSYKGKYWQDTDDTKSDEGGVHTNSGVQSYWYYLLTQDATVGQKLATDLCFAEIRYYANSYSDYTDIYYTSLAAAKYHQLNGIAFGDEGSDLYKAVKKYWKQVNVGPDEPTGIDDITTDATTVAKARKIIRNGQILIEKNGQCYDIMGRLVK